MGDRSQVAIERRPRRSDATFWADGTQTDYAYWGQWQARRWRRAGWKKTAEWLAFVITAGTLGEGLLSHPAGTVRAAAVVLGFVGGFLLIRAVRWREDWRHNRDWVHPYNDALPPGVTVAELARDRTRATLALARDCVLDEKIKEIIMMISAAKLALPLADLAGDWSKQHGKKPEAVIRLVPPPPGYVSFAGIKPHADDAKEHEIVFGIGRNGVPVIISVKNESPHIGLSMSSGDGKSVAVRNAAGQLAHHGAIIAVLDPKLISQHCFAGLRNVAYARTAAEMHELALWLAGEVERRNDVVLYTADVEGDVQGKVGPRIIGILEELNVAQMKLAAYWKEELGGKGKSPAVLALDLVSASGRQVDVNLVYVGQRLSAKATSAGSGDSRENLGVLLMSNPAASTWRMLVGDRHALPPGTDVQGRLQIVAAKTVTEVQGAYVTGKQAREYATSGVVAVPRSDMPCVGGLAPVGTPERLAQDVPGMAIGGAHPPDLHIVPDIPERIPPAPQITIPEAVAQGISGPSYEAVRKALARDPDAPQPVGRRGNADTYDRVEWCDWEEARRRPRKKVTARD